MSSKTILIDLSIFRCGGEKSVHGRPYQSSLRTTVVHKTLKILPRGANLSRRNAASMIALESAEWFDLQHNFLFYNFKAKALPVGIGSQTENTIKGGSRETKGQKSTGSRRTGYGKREIVTSPSFPLLLMGAFLL